MPTILNSPLEQRITRERVRARTLRAAGDEPGADAADLEVDTLLDRWAQCRC